MRTLVSIITAGVALAACGSTPGNAVTATEAKALALQPVTLTASDGVKVFGDYYPAANPKALIVLFHQARSSAGEYRTIAPRLVATGYSALAIDQRSGGGMYGRNRTAAALGKPADYLAAQPDMQAALDWALAKAVPVAIWGSSYSSALVFPLTAANPGKVKAVVAFSPGEYFDDKTLVSRAAAKVTVPVYVTSAPDAGEVALAKAVFDATATTDKTRYVPKDGVHASSTLIAAKNPAGSEANWASVLAFLSRTLG